MKTKKRVKQIEKQINEPLTQLMNEIHSFEADVTLNDVFEIRNGKYRIIKTIYDVLD